MGPHLSYLFQDYWLLPQVLRKDMCAPHGACARGSIIQVGKPRFYIPDILSIIDLTCHNFSLCVFLSMLSPFYPSLQWNPYHLWCCHHPSPHLWVHSLFASITTLSISQCSHQPLLPYTAAAVTIFATIWSHQHQHPFTAAVAIISVLWHPNIYIYPHLNQNLHYHYNTTLSVLYPHLSPPLYHSHCHHYHRCAAPHIWQLPDNYLVFTVVMVIYR